MPKSHHVETRMVFPIFPADTNHYGTLFGGQAVAWIDQAAFVCATRWCRRKVVTVHLSEVNFRHPVREGSIVELIARLVRTGRSSMHISVEMWWEPMDHEERVLACQAECVLVAIGDDGKPVPVPSLDPAALAEQ
ncbi:acyl-CoA thioesterase [uncultured Chloroflexus sp.]|uniref:acyl-CoA thioesterase n=1 Tax=uncultured Chloroflexus sp. TaxID=214040 RepID=UPI00261415EC|nr:acyl-CoA thioesterase [uncultured Chloroflexus sp.]